LDREGVLWIGTKNNGLDRYDAVKRRFIHNIPVEGDPNTLSSPYIRVIYEDRNEDLWIGTRNGGLNVLERESQRFTHYHSDPADPYSLSNHYIISIYEDRSGTLWLGSFGGGLNKFNRQDSTFTHYRMQDGLPSDIVYGILEDKNGMLWLSTNNGLSKFDPASDTFVNFDVDDGLQSTEFSNGAYLKSRSGEMFFGGIHGFNLFDPEFIGEGNPFKPSVVLTSITQDGIAPELDKALENLKELTLRWPKNSFEFEFTALSYIHPEKNQYAYKLDEYDPEWIYIGRKRSGRYVNLPGGTYTLRMKASNNDGAWNEDGASLRIVVVPPIWYDWKFLGGVLLALAIGASLIYRMRARGIEVRSRELARQVEERTQELLETNQLLEKEITERKRVEDQLAQQAAKSAVAAERSRLARELHDAVTQTLFSASLIAEALPASWENNAREGRELLDELRQLSKGALAEMRTLLLELRPSALAEANMAELLRQLAEAVSGREGIPVSVIVNGDCQLPHDVHIALYRIAQEALNNVVKHAHASAVEVRLDSTVDSNKTNHCHIDNESCLCVELCIKDNGFGFDPQKTPTNHLGLAIMRERARAVEAELSIESQPGYGTCIRVGWSGIGRKE
jgi:signal transduction histidine kinase